LPNRQLKRVTREQALRRYELAARTESEFINLVDMYDKLDENRERKERDWEILSTENFIEWQLHSETVIPRPIDHEYWRQLLNGNPIDVIYDCPHEIQNLVSSPSIVEPLSALDENHKEIFYYRIIRRWSPQKIAALRGQTDRNIRKVYDTAMKKIRKQLYRRLSPRYEAGLPLTFRQREFCKNYENSLKGGKNEEK